MRFPPPSAGRSSIRRAPATHSGRASCWVTSENCPGRWSAGWRPCHGVYAVEQHGPQQHAYTLAEFLARYRENFGSSSEIGDLPAAGPPLPDRMPFRLVETGQARDPNRRDDRSGRDRSGSLDAGATPMSRRKTIIVGVLILFLAVGLELVVRPWNSATGCVQIVNEGGEPWKAWSPPTPAPASASGRSPLAKRPRSGSARRERDPQARIHPEGKPDEGVPGRRLRPDGARRDGSGWSWSSKPIRSSATWTDEASTSPRDARTPESTGSSPRSPS